MTPETRVKISFKSDVAKILPKGSWLFQLIESSTTIGLPDVYFSSNTDAATLSFWLEAKTLDYALSPQQFNWAFLAHKAGAHTYLATRAHTTTNPRPHNTPSACSTTHPQPNLYPQITEQPYGPLITFSHKQKGPTEHNILLALDPTMLDCSSIGVYIRRHQPPYLLWTDYLHSLSQGQTHPCTDCTEIQPL